MNWGQNTYAQHHLPPRISCRSDLVVTLHYPGCIQFFLAPSNHYCHGFVLVCWSELILFAKPPHGGSTSQKELSTFQLLEIDQIALSLEILGEQPKSPDSLRQHVLTEEVPRTVWMTQSSTCRETWWDSIICDFLCHCAINKEKNIVIKCKQAAMS